MFLRYHFVIVFRFNCIVVREGGLYDTDSVLFVEICLMAYLVHSCFFLSMSCVLGIIYTRPQESLKKFPKNQHHTDLSYDAIKLEIEKSKMILKEPTH